MPRKPADFFSSLLPKYFDEVRNANSEAGKSLAFLHFIRTAFSGIDVDSPRRLIPELEKRVAIRSGTLLTVGRVDALLGNLVIEFKIDLDEERLSDAKTQLKKYVVGLWALEGRERNYILLATDGLLFRVFSPSAPAGSVELDPEDVTLEEVNSLDFPSTSPDEAFQWLDRYILWRERIVPTADEVSQTFGVTGPTFPVASELLRQAWSVDRESVEAPFEEWRRYLSVVYGTETGDESLFLRHTYLATLAKLMVYSYYSSGALPSKSKIHAILSGEAFRDWGIDNFLEEDFFSWVSRGTAAELGVRVAVSLLAALERYDLSKLTGDVLKGLYQGLVDPISRHELGEFYTPDWLAELVVDSLAIGPKEKVLDPACGSGTFLVSAIDRKKSGFKGNETLALSGILDSVTGIDVHPLAVLVSKANYLLALGTLVKYKHGRIQVPVYLANSVDFPIAKKEIQHGISTYRYPVSRGISLGLPSEVVSRGIEGPIIDAVTQLAREFVRDPALDSKDQFEISMLQQIPVFAGLSRGARDTLWDTCKALTRLIGLKHDSIYSFVIKNVYRPSTVKRMDVLIGNPPWLSYRFLRVPEYQRRIKQLTIEVHHLLESDQTRLLTHMEQATLFFVRSAQLYLQNGGRIAYVMPRSVFTADQHERFRLGAFDPPLAFYNVLDFDRNQQDRLGPLFSVESCVIFAKRDGSASFPLHCSQFAGSLPEKNVSLSDFNSEVRHGSVSVTARDIHLVKIGSRTSWSYEDTAATDSLKPGTSPYADRFRQGATIVPRAFWFTRPIPHPRLGFDPSAPYVESTPHSVKSSKQAWSKLEGRVESGFIFATLLGGDVLPFASLPFQLVVLPVIVDNGRYQVLDSIGLRSRGFQLMSEWTRSAEVSWNKVRGIKATKMSLRARLDNQKGISAQSPTQKLFVIYNTSGRRNLSATVLKIPNRIAFKIDDRTVSANGFVAESSTYVAPIASMDEGYYLASILNSDYTFDVLRRIKAVRHVHKKVWELPIPEYKAASPAHAQLSSLGRKASEIAAGLVGRFADDPQTGRGESTSRSGKLRREVRQAISTDLDEINGSVQKLLSK